MRNMDSRRWCLVLLSAALGLAGCGRGKDEPVIVAPSFSTHPSPVSSPVPQPKEAISVTAGKISVASRDDTCTKMGALIHPYLRARTPDDQVEQCRNYLGFTKGMKVVRSGSYGTGAVIDFTYDAGSGERRMRSMLLALDKDATFRLFAVDSDHPTATVGTKTVGIEKVTANAAALVSAIRSGDCNTMFSLAHPGLAPGANDSAEFCAQYNRSGFQLALQGDAGAVPVLMGSNSTYAFYGLRVKPDRYYTIAMAKGTTTDFKFISELRAEGL